MTSPTRGGLALTGLPAPIADPGAHSSEATAGGSRASDSFDRREQGASGLVHSGARVLVRDMTHETRDGGEASAGTLAAPVVAITEGRENGRRGVAASGQTEQERPHVTERRRCVHARKDQHVQGEQAEKALQPAQEPAEADPHDTWNRSIEHAKTPAPV